MTSGISNLLEQQGWLCNATLQRFKTFIFPPEIQISVFASQLLKLDFSRQIHMQVTPKQIDHAVEVYLSYEAYQKEAAEELLLAIENAYNEVKNPDS